MASKSILWPPTKGDAIRVRPDEYDVVCTPRNIGDKGAIFEATHGIAPKYAGQDKVNPGSVILSGALILEHLGWNEAAKLVVAGVEGAMGAKTVTYDFARQMPRSREVKCSEFGSAIIEHMR